jgi:hypothetical protein
VFEYNTRLGDADYVSYQSAEAAISCPNPQQDLAWFLAVGARPVDVDSTMLPYRFVSGEHTPAPVRPLANQPIIRPPKTSVQFTGEVTYQVRGGTVVRQPIPFYLSLTKSKQDAPSSLPIATVVSTPLNTWVISLSSASFAPITLYYTILTVPQGGTPVQTSVFVTIPSGSTSVTVPVPTLVDPNYISTLTIQTGSDYTIGGNSSATITITPVLIDITSSLISISGGNQFIDSVNTLVKSGRLTSPADLITVTPMGLVTDSVGGSDSKLKNYLVIPSSINNPNFVLNNFEFKATFVGSPNPYAFLLACGGDNLTTPSSSNAFQILISPTTFELRIMNFAQNIGGNITTYGVFATWNTTINTVEIKRLGSVITFKINGTTIPTSVLSTFGGGCPPSAPIGNFSGKPYLINGYDGYLVNNSPVNNSLHGTPIVLKSMRLETLL